MNNAWLILLTAGLLEVGFTTCMKLSEGFSKIPYTIAFLICAVLSLFMLNKSTTQIPLGTAYAVWTGIGTVGTAIIGMAYFKDPMSLQRIALLITLIGTILGLKLVPSS